MPTPPATGHVPSLAPGPGEVGPRRSLVLAGGGMRVAYQAGALLALEEAGLRFTHIDASSGGTINLAMHLSGLTPAEMCERWRSLNPLGFMALLPPGQYLRSFRWPALGGASGVAGKVFPHLGIDAARIRSAEGLTGTFNLCNYTQMIDQVIEHTEIDEDLLIAGVSLPMLMPAVAHGGETFLDAVWIRDANPLEAVRRGADEVWLIWCIGNLPRYDGGLFRQYVHMIEMAANGALGKDFERVRELNATRTSRAVLHVIKPHQGIPLDPSYLTGRIDAATLADKGYQDARRYLDQRRPEGVPWDGAATRMVEPPPRVGFRLEAGGPYHPRGEHAREAARRLELHLALEFDATAGSGFGRARVFGDVGIGGTRSMISEGTLAPDRSDARLELTLGRAGAEWRLQGRITRAGIAYTLSDGDGAEVGEGLLPLGYRQLAGLIASVHAAGTATVAGGISADARLLRQVAGIVRGA